MAVAKHFVAVACVFYAQIGESPNFAYVSAIQTLTPVPLGGSFVELLGLEDIEISLALLSCFSPYTCMAHAWHTHLNQTNDWTVIHCWICLSDWLEWVTVDIIVVLRILIGADHCCSQLHVCVYVDPKAKRASFSWLHFRNFTQILYLRWILFGSSEGIRV